MVCRDMQALPPHPLAFASFKLLQICLARKEEFEEGFPLKAAGLLNAKEYQVRTSARLMEAAGYISLYGEMSNGSFSSIIMPRNIIMVEEGAYSGDFCHPIRRKPATQSGGSLALGHFV
jgi:hypothetical protein